MTDQDAPVVVRRVRAARGPAGRPVRVLLLHGLASSGATWDAFAPLADDDCELWVAELPWRGEGVPGWAERDDVGGWAAEALAGVPGGADVVVAHSFGANALLAHLVEAAATPSAVVLVSPFYRPSAADFDWAAIDYYLNDFHRILADGIRVRSGGRLAPDRQEAMALKVRERVGAYGWVRFFSTYLGTPRLPLDRIGVPCLVVAGETDFAAFPADAIALAAGLPDARVHVVAGCGHFAMVEQAEAFAALVNRFLTDILRNRAWEPLK
ncbi:alpha/beta fold hydrolase [Saccharothrix algeriensis]|uniref:Alpha/beta fold hydrolase n=1 Tax=Saccharothrix algeriensis TaxID=173560 RepID=A0A8T8I1M5_9PSEU|nr:alpha/beta fold hydrolase [Saccharothrix algeriensis]MBM7810380.1 pimeloyl-ACP methyl ester carboxylesterase [Saccharothrix algeriensis]QTR04518.1 alpha/beta fold hydrolase [Saccharothrix algeriensis]